MSMHSGTPKSGPFLLEASQHVAIPVRPDATPPGKWEVPPVTSQPRQPAPAPAAPDEPWVKEDWRTGDGGAFHSPIRPKMSSDVPHPSDVLDPSNKRHRAVLDRLAQGEDPIHDPWNVLGGSGKNFEDLVQHQVGHMQNATPEQNYEGRVWYRAAHEGSKDLADKTIGDHPKTVAIMSALSPKTEWDENVEKAHHFLTHYTGDPNDPNFILPGMQGPVDKAKKIWHDPNGAHQQILSGPKTSAFSNNILDPSPLREPRPGEHDDAGYYQHPINPHTGEPDWRLQPDQDATMDTHHVRMSNNAPGSSLAHLKYDTPEYFNRKISVNGQKFDPSYDLHARANWEATRRLNAMQADPERAITPKQSQAIAWTKFKNDVDTDPDLKKHMQPEPGVAPKSMGPLTNPIPRYQKERSPDWWDDPRRPHVDLRQTPNWHRRPASTANNGSVWGKWLGDYIARNPQHPNQDAPVTPIRQRTKPRRPNAPRTEHKPRKTLSWYIDALDATTPNGVDPETGISRGAIGPANPADGHPGPPGGFNPDVSLDTSMVRGSSWEHPSLHDWNDRIPQEEAHSRLRETLKDQGTPYTPDGMTHALQEYQRTRDDYLKHGSRWFLADDSPAPGSDAEKAKDNPTGMASGDISGASQVTTPSTSGGQFGDWSGDPHASPLPSSGGHGGGGYSGGGASGAGGGSTGASGGSHDEIMNHIRNVMTPQFSQYGITDPQVQQHMMDQVYQQGETESGWRDIPQAIQDVNSAAGHPADSYLQYVPSTFNHAMDLAGTPGANPHDLDSNIRGILPLEMSEGKVGPQGFSDTSGSGVGYGHGWG